MPRPKIFNLYGRATLEFNCKPQRFLNSGDTAQTISTSGGTITNPTAFYVITAYGWQNKRGNCSHERKGDKSTDFKRI